jgi:hypothetical protein
LKEYGWYRIDARGNKPGVNAQFRPPNEALAFPVQNKAERDLPEIWPEPLQVVVDVLEKYENIELVFENLPNIQLLG